VDSVEIEEPQVAVVEDDDGGFNEEPPMADDTDDVSLGDEELDTDLELDDDLFGDLLKDDMD